MFLYILFKNNFYVFEINSYSIQAVKILKNPFYIPLLMIGLGMDFLPGFNFLYEYILN